MNLCEVTICFIILVSLVFVVYYVSFLQLLQAFLLQVIRQLSILSVWSVCYWKGTHSILMDLRLVKLSGCRSHCPVVYSSVLSSCLLVWGVGCKTCGGLATQTFSAVSGCTSYSFDGFSCRFFLGLVALALSCVSTTWSSNKWWFRTSNDLHCRCLTPSLTYVLLSMI
jgi:hypothetical protein